MEIKNKTKTVLDSNPAQKVLIVEDGLYHMIRAVIALTKKSYIPLIAFDMEGVMNKINQADIVLTDLDFSEIGFFESVSKWDRTKTVSERIINDDTEEYITLADDGTRYKKNLIKSIYDTFIKESYEQVKTKSEFICSKLDFIGSYNDKTKTEFKTLCMKMETKQFEKLEQFLLDHPHHSRRYTSDLKMCKGEIDDILELEPDFTLPMPIGDGPVPMPMGLYIIRECKKLGKPFALVTDPSHSGYLEFAALLESGIINEEQLVKALEKYDRHKSYMILPDNKIVFTGVSTKPEEAWNAALELARGE